MKEKPQGPCMTEHDWRSASDPTPMLEYLQGKVSDRKLRLFACACCRQVWNLLLYVPSRTAVEVAERYADGAATERERGAARASALTVVGGGLRQSGWAAYWSASFNIVESVWNASASAAEAATYKAADNARLAGDDCAAAWDHARAAAGRSQAALLHELFGDIFRSLSLQRRWITPTVTAIAQQAYEGRDFALLPILADALEDAGCDLEALLLHLRSSGDHVRGCWAIDMILGQE
jgi:hypothetical protein